MSRTTRKNGRVVESSLERLCREGEFSLHGRVFVSVGQVAKDTGFSKPTCRKYLEMLFSAGCAERCGYMGMFMYASGGK